MNDCGLLDSSAKLRNVFEIDTQYSNVVLFLLFFSDCDSLWSINSFVHLETQKVLDLNSLNKNIYYFSTFEDVNGDWEMGICQYHLELISISNSVNHVSDDTSDGSKDCISLFLLKPHPEFKSRFVSFSTLFFLQFEGNMFELLGQRTQFSFNSDDSWFNINCNSFWNLKFLFRNDILHKSPINNI